MSATAVFIFGFFFAFLDGGGRGAERVVAAVFGGGCSRRLLWGVFGCDDFCFRTAAGEAAAPAISGSRNGCPLQKYTCVSAQLDHIRECVRHRCMSTHCCARVLVTKRDDLDYCRWEKKTKKIGKLKSCTSSCLSLFFSCSPRCSRF